MPLVPAALAGEIVSAMQNQVNDKNADKMAMIALGNAIAGYLTKNTMVVYAWSGIMPGPTPTPDPMVMYTTTSIMGTMTLSPTGVSDPAMNGVLLGKQITDAIRAWQIMPAAGWTLPPGGFLCAPSIVLPPCSLSDSFSCWLSLSNIILTFYKAWIKPVPLMGMHGSYLAPPGAGAIMNLIS
jgi:hypothetical protein